jgi:hypothetical protein
VTAEDVEYVNPADAVEPGVKRGRKYFAGICDVYDDVVIAPERIVAVGAIDTHQGYLWTVRNGQAVRFRWFRRPAEALAEAGVDP